MEERTRQNLMGILWIFIALVTAGVGVGQSDLWLAAFCSILSIAQSLLGAGFFWNERLTVAQ
ncbi:hypothetical protein C486_06743 [Natrinema gari JCM 14663]|uniref:Uncharacterized protein n=1 Tax=Natrinema gari JCM 14663 TaxID=1230459 RepID=L9Z6Z5_9EURY|nr:hypothetical protein C486_06743 [Natrinema gari JCM 14663]